MPAARSNWFELASAAPLVATEWLGLGPFRQPNRADISRLTSLASSTPFTAIDSVGVVGAGLLSILVWYGGDISDKELASETDGARPVEIAESIDRLAAAGLVERRAEGLRLTSRSADSFAPIGVSMSDQNAITSDVLAQMCPALGIRPAPTHKQARIDAIAALFSTEQTRRGVIDGLSPGALGLLKRIADVAGPHVTNPDAIGLANYGLHRAAAPRYEYQHGQVAGELRPLAELTSLGIVGLDDWQGEIWIWREAWPLLGRPLIHRWPTVPLPATAPLVDSGLRLPPLVGLAERALQHWDHTPPAVLKNGERRLAKTVLRSTAKALGTDEATIEIIATTVLSMGLLLQNVTNISGRGRNRSVDEVWLADPELRAAWTAASAPTRWLRMVSEWTNPQMAGSDQAVANRHLLLWELGSLDDGQGWVDDQHVGRWLEHRCAPIAVDEAVVESLRDLRVLGMVTADGPVGLSALGRLALVDPDAVEDADFGSADSAIVQADETVVCPPDLDVDLMVRLGHLGVLESDVGARIFRLDETLITKAVQQGDSSEEIIAFLEDLSSVPLPDTVLRLVGDAAARAGRVRVVGATTVVVTDDPVDLVAICKVTAAKLTAVTDTVAVSTLAPAKVRQILDKKGLAPTMLSATGHAVAPRKASDEAARLERAAERQREFARRHNLDNFTLHAEHLEEQAAQARNPASKLAVKGPLAVTPALLEKVLKSAPATAPVTP